MFMMVLVMVMMVRMMMVQVIMIVFYYTHLVLTMVVTVTATQFWQRVKKDIAEQATSGECYTINYHVVLGRLSTLETNFVINED